jgi:hypothetical protein
VEECLPRVCKARGKKKNPQWDTTGCSLG